MIHALNTDIRRNKIVKLYNFDLKKYRKTNKIDPNSNYMQHKLLKTDTYYSFTYNLPFLLVFTTFVDILCLFGSFSLLDILRNILLN